MAFLTEPRPFKLMALDFLTEPRPFMAQPHAPWWQGRVCLWPSRPGILVVLCQHTLVWPGHKLHSTPSSAPFPLQQPGINLLGCPIWTSAIAESSSTGCKMLELEKLKHFPYSHNSDKLAIYCCNTRISYSGGLHNKPPSLDGGSRLAKTQMPI